MNPFRGKPEKPERSKGEIHSRFIMGARRSCDGDVRAFSASFVVFDPVTNACTFLLVGRRDPLGVGLRIDGGAREHDLVSSFADLFFPADSLDGIRKV